MHTSDRTIGASLWLPYRRGRCGSVQHVLCRATAQKCGQLQLTSVDPQHEELTLCLQPGNTPSKLLMLGCPHLSLNQLQRRAFMGRTATFCEASPSPKPPKKEHQSLRWGDSYWLHISAKPSAHTHTISRLAMEEADARQCM